MLSWVLAQYTGNLNFPSNLGCFFFNLLAYAIDFTNKMLFEFKLNSLNVTNKWTTSVKVLLVIVPYYENSVYK